MAGPLRWPPGAKRTVGRAARRTRVRGSWRRRSRTSAPASWVATCSDPWAVGGGEDPPYHNDVFILTHYPRDPLEMKGGTSYHFVTDGIERALERAQEAANGQDVRLWGGAQAINQYMAAGLLDVLELHVVPVLLGGGARLFENLGGAEVRLEQVRAVEAPGVTHVKYRVLSR